MMHPDKVDRIGRLIDDYYARAKPILRKGVASRQPTDYGIPPEMFAGPISESGWVEWKVIPSTLKPSDIEQLETEFGVQFPPSFRAYLLARHHCFDQMSSRQHDELIQLPDLPSRDPLRKLREELTGWRPLIAAGLIPFAEFGDGYGPICFDTSGRSPDGECPILWLDHEVIAPMGDKASDRAKIRRFEQPLYDSFEQMLQDLFGVAGDE